MMRKIKRFFALLGHIISEAGKYHQDPFDNDSLYEQGPSLETCLRQMEIVREAYKNEN